MNGSREARCNALLKDMERISERLKLLEEIETLAGKSPACVLPKVRDLITSDLDKLCGLARSLLGNFRAGTNKRS